MLLVLEVVEGKLAGERFEIGQDGVDIIRKPTGKFFAFFFPKKMVLILSVSPQVNFFAFFSPKKWC